MRRYHLIVLILIALLGGVAALAITRSPVLGLDLQGGLEVVLEAKAPPGRQVTPDDLDRSIEIMRSRVDRLGVSEPEIRKQGEDQIVIQLAGVHDQARAAELIGKTAQLQFYDLEGDIVSPSVDPRGFPVARSRLYPLLAGVQEAAKEGTPSAWYLYSDTKNLLAGPEATKQDILRQFPDGKAPEGSEFLAVPGNRIILTCGPDAVACPGVDQSPPTRTYYYLFKSEPTAEQPIPEMTGNDLRLGGTRQDFDPQTGLPVVTLEFTDAGADKFHDITRDLAVRGRLKTGQFASPEPILQHFAIVLDGEIRSWPSIDFNQYPDGIAGNRAEISGLASVDEANDLALVLQTGALPLRFDQIDRTDISATLGEESLRQALIAGIGGLAAVALFLLIFYRFLGLVAIIGLGIYGVLLYGAILLFDVTLSLPGFAGLILTIGVAADANIVVFERIKEEVRAGKSVRAAINTGYRKGFSTIIDANVVTMITAFVLFAVATAGVKGFALMLLIGTALSMFTAVAATRALLGMLSGFRWFDNPAFMGASAQKIPAWQRIDFMGKRRIWFAISGAVLVIGIGSLFYQGLNLGIDFDGGSQISFQTPQPLTVEEVRQQASSVVPSSAVIQGRGEVVDGGYTNFQIRTESLTQAEQNGLSETLTAELDAQSLGIRNVSGSFSSEILRGAILAVVVSLALIAIYVSIRFQWKFAVPVLVALVHDLFITLGVYSLTQREVTTATVAAVLTILGYSIYDTIIIFDRVRENILLMKRSSFAQIANQSIWETMRRSLATSFITLLPIVSLLLFGGETLKDFAFALVVGIVSGAYSTIFIAAPILAMIKEREPEYAARKGQAEPVEKTLVLRGAAEERKRPERRSQRQRGRRAAAVAAVELERERYKREEHVELEEFQDMEELEIVDEDELDEYEEEEDEEEEYEEEDEEEAYEEQEDEEEYDELAEDEEEEEDYDELEAAETLEDEEDEEEAVAEDEEEEEGEEAVAEDEDEEEAEEEAVAEDEEEAVAEEEEPEPVKPAASAEPAAKGKRSSRPGDPATRHASRKKRRAKRRHGRAR
jgi:SecD/SecF fusion protein